MSQYGPPGGRYPSRSPDPWPGQQPDETYRQPADPWGDQDPWAEAQTSGQPGGYPPVSGQPGHSSVPILPGNPPTGHLRAAGQPGSYPPDPGHDYPGQGYPSQTDHRPGGDYRAAGQHGGYGATGSPAGSHQGQRGGYPDQGYPGQGGSYPDQGYPGQGYPGQGGSYPGQGGSYPGQGGSYPGQGHRDRGGSFRDQTPAGHPATRAFETGAPPPGTGAGWSPAGAESGWRPSGPGTDWSPAKSGSEWSTVGPADRRKGNGRVLIAVLVVLAVLVFGGGATAIYLLGQDDAAPVAGPDVSPSPTAPGEQTRAPGPVATTAAPQPESSSDARFVKAGQCVKNEGTRQQPKLAITSCAPKTWKVLKRFDGATSGEADARKKCANVEGYTDWFFFDSPLDMLDYVLCLRSVDQ